ncbi:MAG TPA: PaaI family thioesterase [Rhizomicrobium sp.]|nr:PaaI family thioesterase [Rhizomicrobium sp.]
MTDDLFESDLPTVPAGYEPMQWTRGFGRQIGPLYQRTGADGSYARAFLVCEHHTNGMMNCHGGMLMAFADTAFGHAVSMKCADHYWVTVRLVTDFLSAAKLGDWVEGSGDVAGIDDDLYTVKGRIWCGDRTIMTGTGIFKTLGKRPPRHK